MSWKTEIFSPELERIKSEKYRTLAVYIIDNILPETFFIIQPSSSGKYHPQCTHRKGGLIVHTKRLLYLAGELTEACKFSDDEKDQMIIAGIVHDMEKKADSYSEEHPVEAKNTLRQKESELIKHASRDELKTIYDLVIYHMGPFSPKSILKRMKEYTIGECIIYFSDYLASRKFIGTPVDDCEIIYPEGV